MNALAQALHQTKRLLAPREKFLVLELLPGERANATFLSVDEDHNLIFEKTDQDIDVKKFLNSPWRRLKDKHWEGKHLFKSRRKMVVAADSSLATTMPVPLELARERTQWTADVTLDEIENLIAQAMQKVFTQCRSEAAKRLSIDDIHVILVGARADHFKVDGHTVMNPIGFTGKKISLVLEFTFTSREVFDELSQFFSSPDEFFFIESPQAWMRSAARARHLPLNIVDDSRIFIFQKQKYDGDHEFPMLYREKLSWHHDSIIKSITDALGVTATSARYLYDDYRAGKLSAMAARNFKKVIQPAIDTLLTELERVNAKGLVYFNLPYEMPFDTPFKYGGATLDRLPTGEIVTELGLQTDSLPRFRHLAPFLEAYFAKTTSEINQKLRRRLHWLA